MKQLNKHWSGIDTPLIWGGGGGGGGGLEVILSPYMVIGDTILGEVL